MKQTEKRKDHKRNCQGWFKALDVQRTKGSCGEAHSSKYAEAFVGKTNTKEQQTEVVKLAESCDIAAGEQDRDHVRGCDE